MNGFWDWAVAAYERPEVAASCLALQDRQGQSVAYLLWAAWMASEGRAASEALLREGAGLALGWEAHVVSHLRRARRGLKGQGAESLRDRVKAVELEAERTLMLRLEALSPPPGARPLDVGEALGAAAAVWPPYRTPSGLKHLATVLGRP